MQSSANVLLEARSHTPEGPPRPKVAAIEDPWRDGNRMSQPRLDWHLWNWAIWMRSKDIKRRLQFPSRSNSGIWQSANSDFDTMVEYADRRCAAAVDAVLDGLPVIQRVAVHHKHLYAVWDCKRGNIKDAYVAARMGIILGLNVRGIL